MDPGSLDSVIFRKFLFSLFLTLLLFSFISFMEISLSWRFDVRSVSTVCSVRAVCMLVMISMNESACIDRDISRWSPLKKSSSSFL